jgi:DNA-directed RNA polymerase specialized sigma subunit
MRTSIISLSSIENFDDAATLPMMLPEHLRGGDNSRRMRYLKRELRRVIEQHLNEKQRECLLKHYWQGMRRSDIAREQGIGPSQVTKSIEAAQKIIRERLGDFLAIYDSLEREFLREM